MRLPWYFRHPHRHDIVLMTNLDLETLARTFQEEGFVELRGYLAGPAFEDFKRRTVALVERLDSQDGGPSRVRCAKYATVRKGLERHAPWARDFLHEGPQVPIIEGLLGDTLAPASFGWFGKRPGETDRVAPHVDAVGPLPWAGATMWIALDPISRRSGCLHYLRRSHKLPFERGLDIDVSAHLADAQAMEAAPGDAFIHSARTVHWSDGNQTEAPRRAVALFYWSRTAADANAAGTAPGKTAAG